MTNTEGQLIRVYYPLQELLEEAYKRTSYVAGSFSENEPQFDNLSLSPDEKDIFISLLKNQFYTVIEKNQSFTSTLDGNTDMFRTYDNAVLLIYTPTLIVNQSDVVFEPTSKLYYETLVDGTIVTEADLLDTARFTPTPAFELVEMYFALQDWQNKNSIRALDDAIKTAMINGVLYEWYAMKGAPATLLEITYQNYINSFKNISNRIQAQKKPISRPYPIC